MRVLILDEADRLLDGGTHTQHIKIIAQNIKLGEKFDFTNTPLYFIFISILILIYNDFAILNKSCAIKKFAFDGAFLRPGKRNEVKDY